MLPSPVADRIASRIACVGRLVPAKGQDVLIHALHALAKTGHTVECLMVGEGEERFVGTLKQLACEYGLESKIRWLGFVGDVIPLLRTCSILVCPSHREPLGKVILKRGTQASFPWPARQAPAPPR